MTATVKKDEIKTTTTTTYYCINKIERERYNDNDNDNDESKGNNNVKLLYCFYCYCFVRTYTIQWQKHIRNLLYFTHLSIQISRFSRSVHCPSITNAAPHSPYSLHSSFYSQHTPPTAVSYPTGYTRLPANGPPPSALPLLLSPAGGRRLVSIFRGQCSCCEGYFSLPYAPTRTQTHTHTHTHTHTPVS